MVLSEKTTSSSTALLQQLKSNNGTADEMFCLVVKNPTADVILMVQTGDGELAKNRLELRALAKEPERCFCSNVKLVSV